MSNAWPPVLVEDHEGWQFRWAHGLTRRANSVLATGADDSVPALVAEAERFYRWRHAPTMFLASAASAPPSLVDHLVERGYQSSAHTSVVLASTAEVIANTETSGWIVEIAGSVTDEWFAAYWSVESSRGRSADDALVCQHTLLAPPLPAVFVALREADDVVAVGQIVIERGWAGVQCMATRTTYRRRGAASAVLHHLALVAADAGAPQMYLAVMDSNANALSLYHRAGFRAAHAYFYLSAPT